MVDEVKSISDADQAFIVRMNKAIEDGSKSISDADQVRYLRLTGKNWPGGGRTISDRDTGGRTQSDRAEAILRPVEKGGKTISDRAEAILRPVKKHGGYVKKYAKGGGIRKARYK